MTTNSRARLNVSLQFMPVPVIFSAQRLPLQTASATFQYGTTKDEEMESFTLRATKVSSILADIPGYDHSGLNE